MTPADEARLERIIAQVALEIRDAVRKFPPMASPHEGKAVIEEKLEELWEHVKANTGRTPEAIKEARQVAAMAIRYILDLGVYQ